MFAPALYTKCIAQLCFREGYLVNSMARPVGVMKSEAVEVYWRDEFRLPCVVREGRRRRRKIKQFYLVELIQVDKRKAGNTPNIPQDARML